MMRNVRMRERQSGTGKVFYFQTVMWCIGSLPETLLRTASRSHRRAHPTQLLKHGRLPPLHPPLPPPLPYVYPHSFLSTRSKSRSYCFPWRGRRQTSRTNCCCFQRSGGKIKTGMKAGFSQREPTLMSAGSWKVSTLPRPMPNSQRSYVFEGRSQRRRPDQSGFLVMTEARK